MIKNIVVAIVATLLSVGAANAQNCNVTLNQLTNGTTADASQVMANFNGLLTCINNLGNLQGYLGGLTMSNDPTSPNTVIDTTAGVAASDDSSSVLMKLASFTKNANVAWTVGTGNGCLDTGSSLAAATWYHLFVIQRTDTGVVDLLCSTSASSPAFPANYTKKRRIGSFQTDGSAHILAFSQNGDEFLRSIPVTDVGVSNLGTTPTLFTLSGVPAGVKVVARLRVFAFSATNPVGLLVSSPDEASTAQNSPLGNQTMQLNIANVGFSTTIDVRVSSSAQIRAVASSANTNLDIATYGWVDTRGRFN